jgi:hypothetical protein
MAFGTTRSKVAQGFFPAALDGRGLVIRAIGPGALLSFLYEIFIIDAVAPPLRLAA